MVERILGKDEVTSSRLVVGSGVKRRRLSGLRLGIPADTGCNRPRTFDPPAGEVSLVGHQLAKLEGESLGGFDPRHPLQYADVAQW